MSKQEAELIQRAKQRDPVALAEIYQRHQPAIYRYILHRVNNVTTAEDLTSEVFVRLMRKIDGFTYKGRPILAWLYTIARNLVADHHRRSGRLMEVSLDDNGLASIASPDNHIKHLLTQHRLFESLSCLTEEQYEVILLRFVEGFDNNTVAELLGKSVKAVKSLQYRGLIALRNTLEPNGW
jgi:RNA polymerase sigma-70 factor (ECF subfamily)